jgi:hypothetical protein
MGKKSSEPAFDVEADDRCRSNAIFVSIRRLFAILVVLSVLFARVTGAPMAAAPHPDMQMMEGGHCQAPPSKSADHDKMCGKKCCISMCTAVAANRCRTYPG